jgi:hypothetical protein
MQSKKINELGTNVAPSVNDLTVVGDAATGQLKKITLSQISSLFGSTGSVSSVAMTVPTGLTVTGSPITTSGTLAVTFTSGYSIPTTAKQTEWDAGYAERLKWDGGSSGLNAATARTSLGLVIGTDVLAYRTFGTAANNNTGDFATAAQGANADTAYSLRLTGASAPLSISGNVISLSQANTSTSGFLSSTDWNTFNGKQQALNGTGFVKASGTSITYDNSTYYLASNPTGYITSSALSSYLPLSGGTLTGALSITNADQSGSRLVIQNTGSGGQAVNLVAGNPNVDQTGFSIAYGNTNFLRFDSSGAATFSSSVQAAGEITTGSIARAFLRQTAGGDAELGCKTGGITSVWSEGAAKLSFAVGGAATFSSSVTAQGGATIFSTTSDLQLLIGNGSRDMFISGATAASTSQMIGIQNISGANRVNLYDGKLVITSGGNALIGTTTDSGQKLQVNGTSNFSGLLTNYNVYNTQTSSYTLVLDDASKIVEMNVGSANTVTVPTNASVAFPIGTEITVMQYGAGVTTFVAASGVTFRSKDFGDRIGDQYTGATLIKRGTNEWYIIGNIQV